MTRKPDCRCDIICQLPHNQFHANRLFFFSANFRFDSEMILFLNFIIFVEQIRRSLLCYLIWNNSGKTENLKICFAERHVFVWFEITNKRIADALENECWLGAFWIYSLFWIFEMNVCREIERTCWYSWKLIFGNFSGILKKFKIFKQNIRYFIIEQF